MTTNNNKISEIEIEDLINANGGNYELEIIQKIVAKMFGKYKKDLSNKNFPTNIYSIEDSKDVIAKFEKVIRCIRYQVTDIKDLYKKYEDNLELLVELSEVSSLREALKDLVDEYFRIYAIDKLEICCRGWNKKNKEQNKDILSDGEKYDAINLGNNIENEINDNSLSNILGKYFPYIGIGIKEDAHDEKVDN